MTTTNLESPTTADAVGTNRWYLSAAPIVRALVHLCVPMAAAMIVGAVYNLINAGFIGSLHDTALLAAVTFGAPLLGLVMAVGGVFGVGGGALISRLLGAAEHEPAKAGEIKHVSSFAVWGSVIVGAVLGGIGLLLLHPLVSLLGADAAAVPATSAFVAVMLAFVPVLAAAFCLEQLVRAEGAARQVMIGLIASTIANVVFDVLFILVLHWGVAGAALAMGLSNLGVVAYFVDLAAAAQRAREPRAALVHPLARRAEARVRRRRRRAAPGRLPDRHLAGAQQPRGRLRRRRARGHGRRGPHRAGAGVPGDGRHARRAAAARLLLRQGRPAPSDVGAAGLRDHGGRHRR